MTRLSKPAQSLVEIQQEIDRLQGKLKQVQSRAAQLRQTATDLQSEKRWGCFNHPPFKDKIMVQDGWTDDGRRIMKEVPDLHVQPGVCPPSMTSEGKNDPNCRGCIHRAKE